MRARRRYVTHRPAPTPSHALTLVLDTAVSFVVTSAQLACALGCLAGQTFTIFVYRPHWDRSVRDARSRRAHGMRSCFGRRALSALGSGVILASTVEPPQTRTIAGSDTSRDRP